MEENRILLADSPLGFQPGSLPIHFGLASLHDCVYPPHPFFCMHAQTHTHTHTHILLALLL